MRIRSLLFLSALTCLNSLNAQESSLFGGGNTQAAQQQLQIHNKILTVVSGKPITVLDVTKQMDMVFARQYPEYAHQDAARYQFYQSAWKEFLKELINKELVLTDAQESGMTVTKGDVRQELESMFGPNTIETLDETGISLGEAWEMIERDITMRRMIIARIQTKARSKVTPYQIRMAYEEFKNTYEPESKWTYRVISIRDRNQESGKKAADLVHDWIAGGSVTLEDLPKKAIKDDDIPKSSKVSVSQVFEQNNKEISPDYVVPLNQLTSNSYSRPIPQTSRRTKETVHRIFYLIDSEKEPLPSFDEVAIRLKNQLIDKEMDRETEVYLAKLKKQFAVNEEQLAELLANPSLPFTLQQVR